LECRIEANPLIKKIEWYHNNKPLHSSRGIIITNQSLVLQSISKQTHGQYMCRAANIQGSVSSNDLYLDIKCKLIKSQASGRAQRSFIVTFEEHQCGRAKGASTPDGRESFILITF
jgi:Immunoglobulin domain